MLKKLFLTCFLLLACAALPALAEEAEDITARCLITSADDAKSLPKLQDGNYTTQWTSSHRGFLEIAAPEGEAIYGLYISWAEFITDWRLDAAGADGEWRTVYTPEDQFYNQYVPLPEGYERVRMCCLSPDYNHALHIAEVRALGAGTPPAWVQQWKTFTGKADLVLMVTDPGDEYLFFGGLLPQAVAEGREVMLCVIVNTASQYKCELLDGLWHCGMTNYPYIAYFKPRMATTVKAQYENWGEVQFVRHVTRIVRMYQPDVLVTHGVDGEGIDGGHRVCANAAIRAVTAATDSTYDIGYSLKLYGNWQLPKLYLHRYGDTPTKLDYQQPLDFFGGKTAFEVAQEAYAMQSFQKKLAPELRSDGVYDGSLFGLYSSTVGEDSGLGSLFEHLE